MSVRPNALPNASTSARIQIIVDNVAMSYTTPTHLSFPLVAPYLISPHPPPPKTPKKREGKLSTLSSAHPASASTAAALPHRAQATNAAAQTGSVAITACAFAPPPALASAGQVRPALL